MTGMRCCASRDARAAYKEKRSVTTTKQLARALVVALGLREGHAAASVALCDAFATPRARPGRLVMRLPVVSSLQASASDKAQRCRSVG